MKNTVRKSPADRKAELLDIGAKLAAKHGHKNVTRRMVARVAKVTEPLVSNYLGGTDKAQAAYARRARTLGLKMPDKAEAEKIGAKLRAKTRGADAAAKAITPKAAAKRAKKAAKPGSILRANAAAKKAAKAGTAKKSSTGARSAKANAGATKPARTAGNARKRSIKEVKAIKDKAAGKRTAARAPKAPPSNPEDSNTLLPPLPLPALDS